MFLQQCLELRPPFRDVTPVPAPVEVCVSQLASPYDSFCSELCIRGLSNVLTAGVALQII